MARRLARGHSRRLDDAGALEDRAAELRSEPPAGDPTHRALDDRLDELMRAVCRSRPPDRPRARARGDRRAAGSRASRPGTSCSPGPRRRIRQRHGTFRDVIARLPYIAGLGFDVLYLPPIHPIGTTFRKGPNNVTESRPDDLGVPWAIGAPDGGHEAIHAQLGTIEDFRALVAAAAGRGISIALDIAFQASPDHPWVHEHPSWFRHRPDGTVQYAENPPKKYQDIYPFDFESDDWAGLWQALEGVFRHWIAQGVHVFRVDNPHTKAFPFWEWVIARIKADHPEVIFLAEAFTRPKVMYRLAKVGFTQSYTYFTWRTQKDELAAYLLELSRPPIADFFGPNFWPNTPDILHATLQDGGRSMFQARYILAATSCSNIGIYGPAFELLQRVPLEPGSEEYRDSEKYQQRTWDLDDAQIDRTADRPGQRRSGASTRRSRPTAASRSTRSTRST